MLKNGRFIISEGRARLLNLIDAEHSLVKAAEAMHMSYRHCWGLIQKLNAALGVDVVRSTRGGKDGGATCLTELGREILQRYEQRKKLVDWTLRYPSPHLTVDGIVFSDGELVLVRRGNEPYKGRYALPGGFVEYGETLEHAVVREVREETGLHTNVKRLVTVCSDPRRDPRGHVVSAIYELEVGGGRLKAGSDASALALFPLDELPELAFDHGEILRYYRDRSTTMV